jgi:hypothetical protein
METRSGDLDPGVLGRLVDEPVTSVRAEACRDRGDLGIERGPAENERGSRTIRRGGSA